MTTCHFRNCPGRPSGSTIRPDGIELLYCVAHEAIARNLPPLRSAGCCASEGCGRPRGQRSPLCKSCRPRYSAWGLDGNIPAQEAPMTEPITPPAAQQEAAGVGAPPKPAAEVTEADFEPPHPLETRRDALVERLKAAGFLEARSPAEHLRRFDGPNGAVLIPVGHPCEVERDFESTLNHAERECVKVEQAAAPPATVEEFLRDLESGDGEPSLGDVADAPLFVGGTDAAPAELVARWGHKHTAPVQPMSADLDGLAAIAARGQQPTAPGSTVAELHAVCLLMQQLGSYGPDASAMLMRLLPVESRRALLEIEASDARGELARARANVVNPPPPERVAELTAKVATLDARIAALDAG